MLKACRENKQSVIERVRNGSLDEIALSTTSLVDEIILAMHAHGILDCLEKGLADERAHNTTVPYSVILTAAIAAKMKVHTSLTDIPFALSDHRALSKLGYTLLDTENGVGNALMTEGAIRFLLGKYTPDILIDGYNKTVQDYIMPKMGLTPNIHILDCTDIEVNFFNKNYEGSGIAISKRKSSDIEERARGYKLATLRGIVKDSGIIEEIRFGALNIHDLTLSEDMLKTSPLLRPGDILINDRGFISRELINYLKAVRGVDTYVPLRIDMEAYKIAVSAAQMADKWDNHPNKRYINQKITLIKELGPHWHVEDSLHTIPDVPLNGCVVWDTETDHYAVFVTTDTSKSAAMIVKTYCLRPEIEEDYRQIKDFWKLEDFKSTKLNVISFHIICVLLGYLFFQLYTLLPEGKKYAHKCLPVALKKYVEKTHQYAVLYAGGEFGILTLLELLELFASCSDNVREEFKKVMEGK